MEFLAEYGVFLAKAITIVVAAMIIIGTIVSAGMRTKKGAAGHIEVTHLNHELEEMTDAIRSVALDKDVLKQELKNEKKQAKQEKKDRVKVEKEGGHKKRVYVLDFEGDIKASAVESLREEITSILSIAKKEDEVVLKLSSSGGMVHTYGLASSQVQRICDRDIPLTICVDKVAASGGYMMACIADKIIAAPFAILGSIGVVAQLPNFNRLLKKHDVDFELMTAGEYKRTLTLFGENTDKGREKFMEELEDTHSLFKAFVVENRPQLNIDEVATGEVWFGKRALAKKLIDELGTSDDYLMSACAQAEVYKVTYVHKKTLQDRLSMAAHSACDRLILTWWERLTNFKCYS